MRLTESVLCCSDTVQPALQAPQLDESQGIICTRFGVRDLGLCETVLGVKHVLFKYASLLLSRLLSTQGQVGQLNILGGKLYLLMRAAKRSELCS